jgi:hypothetical protein
LLRPYQKYCSQNLTIASRFLLSAYGIIRRGKSFVTRAEKIHAMHKMPILSALFAPLRGTLSVHLCGKVSRRSSQVHLDERVPAFCKSKICQKQSEKSKERRRTRRRSSIVT